MDLDGVEIDAVVLDAGGVLVLPDPAAYRTALEPFGIVPDDEACHRAAFAGTREIDRLAALGGKTPSWREVDTVVARSLGIPDEHIEAAIEALAWVFEQDFVPLPDATLTLARLEASGHPFAVVSNANGRIAAVLEGHGVCSTDGTGAPKAVVVVDSTVVGIEKPEPGIFAFALDVLGVPPERCVYIGDTVHFDVDGARAAGLVPIHLDPYALCPDDDHHHAASLAAAVELLGVPA
ncbi:MAG TPA: HAD family hydrolase [Acidimicrobiales bacterium]|nr:HAD family hydrolase [Acidimicrobiales bacterium]